MISAIKELIDAADVKGIDSLLTTDPSLANEGLPYDETNLTEAHPLHRICDGVYSGSYSDVEAVEMAKVFLAHGARIDGSPRKERLDTPLIAASSLNADKLALLYIEKGANISYTGCHGATAIHWAAWCGRPVVVKRLIEEKADLTLRDEEYASTPLFWAVHGYMFTEAIDKTPWIDCTRLLIDAGAERNTENKDGNSILELLSENDTEMRALLTK